MNIETQQLQDLNSEKLSTHKSQFDFLTQTLSKSNIDVNQVIQKLADFQVAIPSWALGAGGTRFGRFSYGGEPASLEQKIEDIGLIHRLTQTAGAVSLHIPWDVPNDYLAIKELAALNKIKFDAVNSNTFQDQKNQKETYKYGSLSSTSAEVREQAIAHNKEVIEIGEKLGSKSLTVWLADGASFPGQNNFQTALTHTQNSLISIYEDMPADWKMFIEYKPYEPYFYSTVIQDWGTSLMLANGCGERAYTLVDLGHHLPNTNIEQIVSILMLKGKLGGFHFNDSKYGDDDITVGSIKPYTLFLIFNELVYGMQNNPQNPELGWMIDASHNLKDPLEDLIQSLEAIQEAYAKALLIDQDALKAAQEANDVSLCQEILQDAYRTDVRPLIREARLKIGGAINPIEVYRKLEVRGQLINERGKNTIATGL
ncbi:sugar isomerase [Zunongwangia profunda]|uniref:Xylose isomerase-like protein n=3 Tax=Zunongwangia profunda TaxID=398743 RepID=D5BKY6_ZUNPS|nr:sugar isomerase [Zunongwangia profunda]ADF51885.1 xylose isomerase-like protein [Zunongwangia profunda SM-A87]MAS73073.1 sugar isomerase [Zunongwangia sp.]|tara:strand:- start:3406 stop:4686 length:1281 start_codon:yes stop_codon:yes gene_type:complete